MSRATRLTESIRKLNSKSRRINESDTLALVRKTMIGDHSGDGDVVVDVKQPNPQIWNFEVWFAPADDGSYTPQDQYMFEMDLEYLLESENTDDISVVEACQEWLATCNGD